MNRSPLRAFLLIPFVLACFALSPQAQAVVPAPDGGYPGNNTAEGDNALFNLDTSLGTDNTAIGFEALFSNTTGIQNTAIGAGALFSNVGGNPNETLGCCNTANGDEALYSNTTGNANTAMGAGALFSNIGGNASNSLGSYNTANGFEAMYYNTTGSLNSAFGSGTMLNNTTGFNNTATGYSALFNNTIGNSNTADGINALNGNTSGNNNTATGWATLVVNTTGSGNVANGVLALQNNTTGNNNIALGSEAGINLTTGSNNIDIGNAGVAGESRTIRVGTKPTHRATFIAGISGATVPTGVAVIVDANGHLGTTTSSARFKEGIKPMDKTSEAILALKPVTFHYKKDVDPEGIPQFGLVAEEVEKVNPDLVARDEQDKPYTVRYEAVNAMLLNEFLKEHRTVHEQEATIAQLKKQVDALTKGLQKVSDQLELSKPSSHMVVNDQ